jgi:hypothetical protein
VQEFALVGVLLRGEKAGEEAFPNSRRQIHRKGTQCNSMI